MEDALDTGILSALTLCMMWWALSSRNHQIARLEQHLAAAFMRKARERTLLVQSRFHLRKFAQAVSMIEMAGTDKVAVTITIDTFVRDNLYQLVEDLDEYTPEQWFDDFAEVQS
jgi:hypothetical protein